MTDCSFWNKKIFWGIKIWEVATLIGLHVFLGLLYWLTIWLTVSQQQTEGIVINYFYKILLTGPFWWLFFRKLRKLPFSQKLLLHVPGCILYVAIWLGAFYATLDVLRIGRLAGAGIWWDVYIPVLVYLMQFGFFHAYFYWTEIIQQKEKEKALLKLAHTAELNTLKAQIQPHFLFNTLNSISAAVPSSHEQTRTLIAQLADVFRFAMNVTDKEMVTLQRELEFIQNFLALEQHRFGDRLSVEYDIDESLLTQEIPPMLLQPLVENALKHGISKRADGGIIFIRIVKRSGAMYIEVTDTGKGINGTPVEAIFKKGIGLENTQQRLNRLYQTDLKVSPNLPTGFSVFFTVPLKGK